MSIADALALLRKDIGPACLIAVSKTRSTHEIREALRAGQRVFGENRIQEAQTKFPSLRASCPDLDLHLIGPLQTNKARAAVSLFDVIETLDRPALATALAKAIRQAGRAPRLYIEVNIGHEPQKAGIAPENLGAFLDFCRTSCGLKIDGLMCIPPQNADPRPFFEKMRELATTHALKRLSMGMSADYRIALECGATEVRIGTALFGNRPT